MNTFALRFMAASTLLAASVLLSGCLTSAREAPVLMKDGQEYGKVEGSFRGRWWNYYERGRSYLDGGFHEEAERDFRKALAGRRRDQHWPRTYGLHFTPEYFPNRELGITLYLDGRNGEALKLLETSMDQQYSARGAYYLGEARSVWALVETRDREPPVLELDARQGSVQADFFVTVNGTARDDTFVKAILIEDEPIWFPVSAAEVKFSHTFELAPGRNAFKVAVIDAAGREHVTHAQLECDVDGPVVSFDPPSGGRIRGVALDPAGIQEVRFGGQLAALEVGQDGLTRFSILREAVDGPVRYACVDGVGNVTEGSYGQDAQVAAPRVHGTTRYAVPLPVMGHVWMAQSLLSAALGAQERPARARLRFMNVDEAEVFRTGEIIVNLEVDAEDGIAELKINGRIVSIMADRDFITVSRKIYLRDPKNTIIAELVDGTGATLVKEIMVAYKVPEQDSQARRLSLGSFDNAWKDGESVDSDAKRALQDQLERELGVRFRLLDRSLLPEILEEQLLTAINGSVEKRRQVLGRIEGADMLLMGKVYQYKGEDGFIEVTAKVIDAESSAILDRAEVFGKATNPAQLRRLGSHIAIQILQRYPRLQGKVLWADGGSVQSNIGSEAGIGIRKGTRLIVHREGRVVGEAKVVRITPDWNKADRVALDPDTDAVKIQEGDHVVTK